MRTTAQEPPFGGDFIMLTLMFAQALTYVSTSVAHLTLGRIDLAARKIESVSKRICKCRTTIIRSMVDFKTQNLAQHDMNIHAGLAAAMRVTHMMKRSTHRFIFEYPFFCHVPDQSQRTAVAATPDLRIASLCLSPRLSMSRHLAPPNQQTAW